MPKWGNPILQGLIDSFEKQRVKAVQDATRLAKRRPQGAAPERNFSRLGALLGPGAAFGGYAPTFDEMFLEAVQRQRREMEMRSVSAQQREEAAHPEFYKGRRKNALPW